MGVEAASLFSDLSGRTSEEIASHISRLIRRGALHERDHLPTVRATAEELGVNVTTVLGAWAILRSQKLIETRRRGGSVVLVGAPSGSGHGGAQRDAPLDLSLVRADPALQPDLSRAFLWSLNTSEFNRPGREHMTEALESASAAEWPFVPERWTTGAGSAEALAIAIAAAAEPGSSVAVDEPVGFGTLELLRSLGLVPIGVSGDREGPRPDSLRQALAQRPAAYVFQPSAPYTAAEGITASRHLQLQEELALHPGVLVVEDDALGPLWNAASPSFGGAFPERVLRVRGYCRAFGVDLKTAVVGGSGELISRFNRRRSFGLASNSRILMNALAFLMTDPQTADTIDRGLERYHERKAGFLAALATLGVTVSTTESSLIVWVEIADEASAVLELARRGLVVGSGASCYVSQQRAGSLRIAVTQLPDDREEIGRIGQVIGDVVHADLPGLVL